MNTTSITSTIKTTFLFFMLCFFSYHAEAQYYGTHYRPLYYGFKAGIGNQSYTITSNINQIHNLTVLDEGGFAGLVVGNQCLKLSTQIGFFYSADRVPYTIDRVHGSVNLNFYPLAYFMKKNYALQPYIAGGIALSRIMFFGHYLQQEGVKSKIGTDPFLGKVRTTSARLSAGLEYRVPSCDFVHLFVGAQYEPGIKRRAEGPFEQTSISNAGSITFGVCFGSMKLIDTNRSR